MDFGLVSGGWCLGIGSLFFVPSLPLLIDWPIDWPIDKKLLCIITHW
jgi:hypothetical protein